MARIARPFCSPDSRSTAHRLEGKHKAKADAAPSARRGVEVAARCATTLRVVEPTAAAIHAASPRIIINPGGTVVGPAFLVVIIVPLVLHPLPHVAAHVVQAQLIGAFQAHGFGFQVAVFVKPAHFF